MELASARTELVERMRCLPRIVGALNARHGRALDEHELADVTQDALVIVLRKLDRLHERENTEGWIYRIVRFEYMNSYKRKARRQQVVKDLPEGLEPAWQGGLEPLGDQQDHLHEGLGTLAEGDAEVLRMKHFDGLTLDAIARNLEQPPSTVRSRYYRGLAALEAFLAGRVSSGESSHG